MSDDFEEDFEEMPEAASVPRSIASTLSFDDFCAYAPSRTCIYLPCKTPWPNASIDTRLPRQPLLDSNGNPVRDAKGKVKTIPASTWLEQNRSVETFTWAPGEPEFIRDRLAVEGGWVTKPGANTLNTYRAVTLELGDPSRAKRWVDHWHAIYPDDADHIIGWLASRVQHPEVKINHALVLGGAPKIGKDALLEPVISAVGRWNFREITLTNLISKNNEFLRAVIVRLSEARDMGEQGRIDRYGLYDHTKNMLVTPPDMLRINEKYLREYYIVNCFGMVITTNYRDALYLPADDRRHYLAFSDRHTEDFDAQFWNDFWKWYKNEDGIAHVVALLNQYDLSNFDPKAAPQKTPAFWLMVETDRGEAHGELADAIDALGNPKALTINQLIEQAPGLEWLRDLKMRRIVRKRLEDSGYVPALNDNAKPSGGMWVVNKKRQMIYARSDLGFRQRQDAARELQGKLDAEK
jgi:hypothetical protein